MLYDNGGTVREIATGVGKGSSRAPRSTAIRRTDIQHRFHGSARRAAFL